MKTKFSIVSLILSFAVAAGLMTTPGRADCAVNLTAAQTEASANLTAAQTEAAASTPTASAATPAPKVTKIECEKSGTKMKLNLLISDTVPQASVQGDFADGTQKLSFKLNAWFAQEYDYSTMKQYAGYFIPFNGNPAAVDEFVQTWFEVEKGQETETGIAEISSVKLTGSKTTVELSCAKK